MPPGRVKSRRPDERRSSLTATGVRLFVGAKKAYGWPATLTGILLLFVVPSPSPPQKPIPQQYATPPVVTPQVWSAPALTIAKVYPPKTATGVELFVIVPLPSSPSPL